MQMNRISLAALRGTSLPSYRKNKTLTVESTSYWNRESIWPIRDNWILSLSSWIPHLVSSDSPCFCLRPHLVTGSNTSDLLLNPVLLWLHTWTWLITVEYISLEQKTKQWHLMMSVMSILILKLFSLHCNSYATVFSLHDFSAIPFKINKLLFFSLY